MDQEFRNGIPGAESTPPPVQPSADPAPNTPPAVNAPIATGEEAPPMPLNVPKVAPTPKKPAAKKKSPASKSGGKKQSSKKGSKKETARAHSTTANTNGKKNGKKESVNLDMPRSAKPAHTVLPYFYALSAIFVGICLILNLFCNRENVLAATPSAHWMGTVGYYVCYWLFGLFGPAVFVLPLLLINLTFYWKRYVDNRIAISKIVVSAIFMILLGAVIHVICISRLPMEDRLFTSEQLIILGSQMTSGGLVGGSVGYFLAKYLNIAGAIIVGICLLVASLFYFLGMTPHHLWNHIKLKRQAKREGRGTVSEKDAQAAGYEAKVQEKMKRTSAKRDTTIFDEVDTYATPQGAVIPKYDPEEESSDKPARNREKEKSDRLAPMPIPMLDPNEGKLFVPADVNRKLAETNADTKQTADKPAAQAQAPTQAPAQAPAPVNPAANKDTAIEPIFPKNERLSRPIPKQERNFDLKNVFIDFDDSKKKVAPKQHTPVPPEVPMPGAKPQTARPAPAKPVTKTPAPAASAQATAPKAVAPTAQPRPKAAPASVAGKQPIKKPVVHEVKELAQKDFGLSSEEFEKLEAQHSTLPKAGAKPSAKPASATTAKSASTADKKPAPAPKQPAPPKPKKYVFPPITYLHAPEPMTAENREVIEASVNNLYTTLQNFRINITDISYSCGPTVTRYELTPAPGVRVRSIVNLADDISLAFAAKVRIEAPIPGKSAVGIEVPNKLRCNVFLRELIESKAFVDSQSKLTACLGSDVTGKPLLFDIAKMPHLLVAGATGMGKSVCINSIIMSLLYKAKPEEVKLILIDPKKVEFGIYKGIPHLLAPIVTAPKDAAGALQAAVEEMETRFELIQQVGVHDIKGYNKITENDPDMPFMPQIVIIIDELADLMMTAPDEVETAICRLAQKARAAGMHIIIGTQRPSVDVVTGLIKSNIPSRIAFTVASQVDSRTILDVAGAEKLIGKGDMLFAPVGAMGFTRVQGAFVDEKEVENICEFIRATNGTASYDERFTSKMKELSAQCGNKGKGGGGGSDAALPEGTGKGDDAKYSDAVRIAVEEKKISTSLLQRKLEIGYSRAAKLIDRMQAEGIVSPPDGSKPRTILITPEEYIEKFIDVPTEE